MKATVSSAQRNAQMGKINSNYQTAEQTQSNENPIRKSPTKRGKASPMRALRPKSPSVKNKSQSVINLKSTPNKENLGKEPETHFLLQSNLKFNFDETDDGNDPSQE